MANGYLSGSTAPDATWLGFNPRPAVGYRAVSERISRDLCKGNEYMKGFPVGFLCFSVRLFYKKGILFVL